MTEDRPAPPAQGSLARRIEDRLAAPMFFLSLLFLVLVSLLIHKHDWPLLQTLKAHTILGEVGLRERLSQHLPYPEIWLEAPLGVGIILLLWIPFLFEALLGFLIRDRALGFWGPLGRVLLIWLLPPVRLAGRGRVRAGQIWLPRRGWQATDDDLRNDLDRTFSVPMIFFALLVIPVLGVDYFWSSALQTHPGLQLTLVICNAVIWLAFAIELVVKASVARSALWYCVTDWVDLAIVLLPMIEALPIARLLRLGRLARVSRLKQTTRLYRLRGLATKGWRALVILKIFQKMLGHSLEKELRQRRQELEAKEAEVAVLRQEVARIEEEIAEQQREIEGAEEGEEALLSGG